MKAFPILNRVTTYVDDCDSDLMAQAWQHNKKTNYVETRRGPRNARYCEFLHVKVFERVYGGKLPEKAQVDHINGNKLDNRRANLRLASHADNQCNKKRTSRNTSGYKGVSWSKAAKKWEAYISVDKQRHYLGLFLSKEEAALAYNEAAKRLHKAFACLNVIREG